MPHHQNWDFVAARYAPDGERIFVRYFDGGQQWDDRLAGMNVDSDGNVYLAGSVGVGSSRQDIGMMKLSPLGETLWYVKHSTTNASTGDQVRAVTLDRLGRPVCISAFSDPETYSDVLLLRFDRETGAFTQESVNMDTHSRESFAYGLGTSTDGSVYLCGESRRGGRESALVTVAYNGDGTERWRRRIDAAAGRPDFLAVDSEQNIVVAGEISDISENSSGDDILIVKYTPDGEVLWQTRSGIANRDYIRDATLNDRDELLLAGHSSASANVSFLMKVLPDGEIAWLSEQGTWSGHQIAATPDGGAVFTRGFDIRRYSSDGELVWEALYPTSAECQYDASDIAFDSQGNVVLAGAACVNQNQRLLAIAKYDAGGNLLWRVDRQGPPGGSWARRIAIMPNNDILITGMQLDEPHGTSRCFVARYAASGQELWSLPIDGRYGFGLVRATAYDPAGFLYVLKSSELRDVPGYQLLRIDVSGALVWRALYGPGMYDASPYPIALDRERRPIISGYIRDPSRQSDFVTIRYTAAPLPCAAGNECNPGDTNGDCRIDSIDLENVLTNFGSLQPGEISPLDGDLNFDGRIDLADLTRVLGLFGASCE